MKSLTSRNSRAERFSLVGLTGSALRLCGAVLTLLSAALPAQAFQQTSSANGNFEYFFASPSLEIRSSGDLSLTGLSFVEGVADGFRVGASFSLDWLGGENAWMAAGASTWSGLDLRPRTLSLVAAGNLSLNNVRLTLLGGTIILQAESVLSIGDGSVIDVGNSGSLDVGDRLVYPQRPPALTPGGGTLQISPGGDITLRSPSPVPEPGSAALMLAGLCGVAVVVRATRHRTAAVA